MNELKEKYNEDLIIETETKLSGEIEGNIIITNSIIFIITGTIIGNLKIEEGSRAIIDRNGSINGNIICYGLCEVYGTVEGNLNGKKESILIDVGAKIIAPLY